MATTLEQTATISDRVEQAIKDAVRHKQKATLFTAAAVAILKDRIGDEVPVPSTFPLITPITEEDILKAHAILEERYPSCPFGFPDYEAGFLTLGLDPTNQWWQMSMSALTSLMYLEISRYTYAMTRIPHSKSSEIQMVENLSRFPSTAAFQIVDTWTATQMDLFLWLQQWTDYLRGQDFQVKNQRQRITAKAV